MFDNAPEAKFEPDDARRGTVGSEMRVYVDVDATFDKHGRILPRSLVWEDGCRYEIDRVVGVRPAMARSGGAGDRYTIIVHGRESYLFFERSGELTGAKLGRWFVERRAG
jgi:hypothetical protein